MSELGRKKDSLEPFTVRTFQIRSRKVQASFDSFIQKYLLNTKVSNGKAVREKAGRNLKKPE